MTAYTMEDATFVQTHQPLLRGASGTLDGPRWSRPSPYGPFAEPVTAAADPFSGRAQYLDEPLGYGYGYGDRLHGYGYGDRSHGYGYGDRSHGYGYGYRRPVMNDDLRFGSATKLDGCALPANDGQKPLGGIGFPRTALSRDNTGYGGYGGAAAFEEFVAANKALPEWRQHNHLDDAADRLQLRSFGSKCIDDPLRAPASHCLDDPMFRRSALDGRLHYRSANEDRKLWSRVDDRNLNRRMLAHF